MLLKSAVLLALAVLGTTWVRAALDDSEGFAALEQALKKKYPQSIKGMFLDDLFPLLHDLSIANETPPLATKLFKTLALGVKSGSCGRHTLNAAMSVEKRFAHFEQRDFQRVVEVSKTIFTTIAHTCAARRFPVARLMLKDTERLVREQVRNLGKHMAACPAVAEPDKAFSAYGLALYKAVKARALAENDPDAKYLTKPASSPDAVTTDQPVDKAWRDEVRRQLHTARLPASSQTKAIALFKRYAYEPCEVYLSDMGSVLEMAAWEATHYDIKEYYAKNEDFYDALADYQFCKFARKNNFVDLFADLVKNNVQ